MTSITSHIAVCNKFNLKYNTDCNHVFFEKALTIFNFDEYVLLLILILERIGKSVHTGTDNYNHL